MRNIFIALTVAIALAGLLISWNLVTYFQSFAGLPERPAHLETLGVSASEIEWVRSRTTLGVGLGSITDLRPGGFGDDPCPFVVGENGARFVETADCPARTLRFPGGTYHVDAVDWNGDASPEFLSRGQWCCRPMLLDDRGQKLWKLKRGYNGANDTALIGSTDNERELVVGFNGSGGVVRLGIDGTERWRREDGNVWQLAVADTDGDGIEEILHSNARGALVVLNQDGEVISSRKPEGYFSSFDPVSWQGVQTLVHVENGSLFLLALDGTTLQEFAHPAAFDLADPRAVGVPTGDGDWLVSLLSGASFDRSVLAVHDENGALLYSEVLEGGCDAIAGAGEAAVWVGCPDTVFSYGLEARSGG